jgi:hypothetical protein
MDTPDARSRPGSAAPAASGSAPSVGNTGAGGTADTGSALLVPLFLLAAMIGGIYLVGRFPPEALLGAGDEPAPRTTRPRVAVPERPEATPRAGHGKPFSVVAAASAGTGSDRAHGRRVGELAQHFARVLGDRRDGEAGEGTRGQLGDHRLDLGERAGVLDHRP